MSVGGRVSSGWCVERGRQEGGGRRREWIERVFEDVGD